MKRLLLQIKLRNRTFLLKMECTKNEDSKNIYYQNDENRKLN